MFALTFIFTNFHNIKLEYFREYKIRNIDILLLKSLNWLRKFNFSLCDLNLKSKDKIFIYSYSFGQIDCCV